MGLFIWAMHKILLEFSFRALRLKVLPAKRINSSWLWRDWSAGNNACILKTNKKDYFLVTNETLSKFVVIFYNLNEFIQAKMQQPIKHITNMKWPIYICVSTSSHANAGEIWLNKISVHLKCSNSWSWKWDYRKLINLKMQICQIYYFTCVVSNIIVSIYS